MPVLFVGHGSPMNAIEDNQYTAMWQKLGQQISRPKAILSVSAHWYTHGIKVTDAPKPEMVYDMYGFPQELYEVAYRPEGSPSTAHLTKELLSEDVKIDNTWGIDHGSWSVLYRMYPAADIPVFQLSVDSTAPAQAHFQIGRELASLREQGILIFASGNVVHNLARVNWSMDGGYPWAQEFDTSVKNHILSGDFDEVIHWDRGGEAAKLSVPTPDHYFPLLTALGASEKSGKITVFNDSCVLGSLSMTGYLFE